MDSLVAIEVLAFECWRFDRCVGRLFHQNTSGDWLPIQIGSRALAVLDVLLDRPGILVSKDAIMDAVWPHCVAPNNLTVQITTLRRVLDAGRTGGSCIQTVPGRGYRFVVTVTKLQTADAVGKPDPLNASPPRSVMASKAPRFSLVVLPFDNLGGSTREDRLAAAITGDVTTDLCRLDGAQVATSRSAAAYRDKTIDASQLGEALGVRYVVEGSIRKLGNTLHVNVQLISTETNAYLWAGRFRHDLKDIGRGLEEIVSRLKAELVAQILTLESKRSVQERSDNPDVFDLLLRARSGILKDDLTSSLRNISELLHQALCLEPFSVPAMCCLAVQLINRFVNVGDDQGNEEIIDQATNLVAAAAAIAPQSEAVTNCQGYLFRALGRWTEAIAVLQRVVERFPHCSNGLRQLGFCKLAVGQAEAAIPLLQRSIDIDPLAVPNRYAYRRLAHAYLVLGRDAEAIDCTRRALADGITNHPGERAQSYCLMASAHALIGQVDAARHALAEAMRLRPFVSVRTMTAPVSPHGLPNAVFMTQIERIRQGLRTAGLREHADEDADFGVTSDGTLCSEMSGLTPRTIPGAATIHTTELIGLLSDRKPILIDVAWNSCGRSLPEAIGLQGLGHGAAFSVRTPGSFDTRFMLLRTG